MGSHLAYAESFPHGKLSLLSRLTTLNSSIDSYYLLQLAVHANIFRPELDNKEAIMLKKKSI